MHEAAYRHGGWQAVRPAEPIGAQMNMAYAVAVTPIDGHVLVVRQPQPEGAADWATAL